jgi:hypothetical protein
MVLKTLALAKSFILKTFKLSSMNVVATEMLSSKRLREAQRNSVLSTLQEKISLHQFLTLLALIMASVRRTILTTLATVVSVA